MSATLFSLYGCRQVAAHDLDTRPTALITLPVTFDAIGYQVYIQDLRDFPREVEPAAAPVKKAKVYGPPRKGRGGKVKRW